MLKQRKGGRKGNRGKYLGESSGGKERCGNDDRVDGRDAVGNSLGRAPLGRSDVLRSRAVGTGFQDKFHQCDCPKKNVRPRLFKWFANVGRCDMQSFTGRVRTNFINTIVPKNCAPKSCQSFQTLYHGTCIASLAGSETKGAELLARIFQDKFHHCDWPEKSVPKTCQTVSKRWAKGHAGHAWEKALCWRSFFILIGVLSVDALFSVPLQRSKLNDNPSIGYASA